ncbi:MAG: DEAD/DEAH box helicase family protein [Armatimonadota bacterium]|nr:DEAD/DEAH box helicase family protein [Armatimonadota bacterium]
MNESETRAEHIDPALTAAGWGKVEGSRVRREYFITRGRIQADGTRAKPEIADYVLVYKGKKLAILEAKAWHLALTAGISQAKAYAGKTGVRFTYSSNGQALYGVDMVTGKEGECAYPTPEELWNATFSTENEWRDRFAEIPYEDKGGLFEGRYYQDTAVEKVLEAIAAGRQRVLLTLATGTGKTFIAFQIAWKLFHSRWNLSREPTRRPRILFLADRNILADQAYNAFSAFPADAMVRIAPDSIRKNAGVPTNGSIFFTIFQTFMSGPEKMVDGVLTPSPFFGDYPPDFFDFIVIDECHRGGANDESTWRAILEHFSGAVQLGLTATPKRDVNVDTYGYFGDPVYIYSLREGIEDGFLTPFRVRDIRITLDTYVFESGDTVVKGNVEPGRVYGEADFGRHIKIEARDRTRVKAFMDECDQSQKGLVFCSSQNAAADVCALINQAKQSSEPEYCVRVTSDDGERGEEKLREFQDNERTIPTVLTTSHKLSTGVDAKNVRNIVLMREVKSMVEFKQIIGRGTRLYDGKAYFTIWDFVGAHSHFQDPEWDGEPIEPEPRAENPPGGGGTGGGPQPCEECGNYPCTCDKVCPKCGQDPCDCLVVIKLSDGRERRIRVAANTRFYHEGRPITVSEFMDLLFGKLPSLFNSEDELRAIWGMPDTRSKLLQALEDSGFDRGALKEMTNILGAGKWDIFDVLAHVAYATPGLTRRERAGRAYAAITASYGDRQKQFLEFVLSQYVRVGVEELDLEKLPKLITLKYGAATDGVRELGPPKEVRKWFGEFQPLLYAEPPDFTLPSESAYE